MEELSIGFLGGVPKALGGGGLELQMERTAEALVELGHSVERVECSAPARRLDVLHAFHAEPSIWQLTPHWSRNRCALVVSPVLPIRPGRDERLLWISSRLPGVMSTARMRRQVIARADAVVALTQYERRVAQRVFGADPARTVVIGNGVERAPEARDAPVPGLPAGEFLLMVGGVSRRKRQSEVARALGRETALVVVGGLVGADAERRALEAELRASGALWLGEIGGAGVVREIERAAAAVVLVSEAEAQPLVLLEALSVGTPVIASDLPAHRELQEAYPGWVALVPEPSKVLGAWRELRGRPRGERPEIATWSDVANRLVEVYRRAKRARDGRLRG